MFFPRDVGHVDADLAVLDLAHPATPLPDDADRLGPFLGEPRGVENDDRVGFAEFLADLAGQRGEQGIVVPGDRPDEVLQTLPLAIMKVGDRLARLPRKFGEQAGQIFGSMTPLLRLEERGGERLDEALETTEEALHQYGRDIGLGQHLSKLKLIATFHDRPRSRVAPSWKLMMQERLGDFNRPRQ
jgi:hypothetical protein